VTATVTGNRELPGFLSTAAARVRRYRVTRRNVQVVLGLLWVLDGALQAQPFMFTRGFGAQIIAPTGQGQPSVVSAPVHFAATLIAAHPFAWNLLFAAIQVLIGVGLLLPRTARLALIASIAWALGVWWLGEGLSGLASGHASILTGAPGSALLYVVLAAAAWPGGPAKRHPARWLVWAWAVLWVGAAAYQLLPGQDSGTAVAGALTGGAGGAPGWLAHLDGSLGQWAGRNGSVTVYGLATLELLIGVLALVRKTRFWALAVGLVLAVTIWITAQDVGQLYSGQATDPNSAPLIVLMAVALISSHRPWVPASWNPRLPAGGDAERLA
jgi:hypothetical protein